jgi:hypothetical protein
MSTIILELRPEKEREILQYITEAVLRKNSETGVLRKDIWLYIMNMYKDRVDYADFLIAIKKFINAGKMSSKEGFFSMHPSIVVEFLEKNPKMFPAIKKSLVLQDLNTGEKIKIVKDGANSVKKSVFSEINK